MIQIVNKWGGNTIFEVDVTTLREALELAVKNGAYLEGAYADTNPHEDCGRGIHVATLDWCLNQWSAGYRIFVVQFEKDDIAAIPYGQTGKFRLKRCKVVREIDLKAELGWPIEKGAA